MTIMLSGPTIRQYIIQSRIFAIILGCIAIFWGLETFPIFWQQALMERTADSIIRGDQYKIETLLRQMPVVEAAEKSTRCDPRALWSGAIIRLRIAEQNAFDAQQIKSLDNSIRTSLSCSPSDPFLWLALYWEAVSNRSFEPNYRDYLRMSYRLGPNEGWVALKRNPIAFANFDWLPSDLAEDGISEFVGLVRSQRFFDAAANILVGPAWRVRDQVLPRLAELSERDRKTFAQVLQSRGYDVSIPGIQLQKHRD